MRTSGRSSSETLLFIAPAAIVGGLALWFFGDPQELIRALDIRVVRIGEAAISWVSTLFS